MEQKFRSEYKGSKTQTPAAHPGDEVEAVEKPGTSGASQDSYLDVAAAPAAPPPPPAAPTQAAASSTRGGAAKPVKGKGPGKGKGKGKGKDKGEER